MTTLKLTPELINNGLQCPPDKRRVEFCDTEIPGFFIEVSAASPGKGTYCLRYKVKGRTCTQRLGRTTDTSLPEARKRAKTLKAEIQLGADPRGAVRAQKAVIPYEAFFNDHYMPYVTPRKRSAQRDRELGKRVIERFGGLRLNQITRQQVQTFHAWLLTLGLSPASADHHAKLIRQSLNLAVEWGMLDVNPAANIRLFNVDNKVEHYLDDAQLETLMTVLRTDDNRAVCEIALFLLSTGCRLNEALTATWSQVNQETRVWRIPAANSKSKRVRSVPLNYSALKVLEDVGTAGQFEHLFVNHQTKDRYTTIHKVWGRIRRSAGLPHLRIHDLRHMYASFLVNAGCTLYEVQQILGHSDPKVTQRYAHLSSASLQKAANWASVAIQGASVTGPSIDSFPSTAPLAQTSPEVATVE